MSDIYTTSDASSNAAPTVTVASGWETATGTYTGPLMAPFMGVVLSDEEDDDLTVTVTFDTTFGTLTFPNGIVAAAIDSGTIRTYTLTGKAGDLNSIIQNSLFDANDALNGFGEQAVDFTFGVKDADHDTFATGAVTVQLTDGGPPHTAPEITIASGTEVTNAGYLGPDVRPFRGVTLDDADNDHLTLNISFDPTRGSITIPWGFPFWEEKDGVRTYTLSGNKDSLTDLIQSITFDPDNGLEGSGPSDAVFTLAVKDGWQGTPITASVTVAMDNGIPPNAPPEIVIEDGTETTTTTYTNPDNVLPFLGLSVIDEGDELTCRITYDDTYGVLSFPGYAEVIWTTDEVSTFPVAIFWGTASELTEIMQAAEFNPNDDMSGSGTKEVIFNITVRDDYNAPVWTDKISVVLSDPVDPNAAPVNLTLSNTIIDESAAAVIVGVLDASDPDGDALDYILVDADGNEIADTSPFEIQSVRVTADGQVVHRLATKAGVQVAADETHEVYIKADDGRGGSVTQMFTVTIKNVVPPNAAPTLVVADGAAITTATDTGANVRPFMGVSFDDAEDDTLTVSISYDPAGGELVLPANMHGVSFSVAPGTGLTTYTFSGKKAALAALMDALAFDPVRQNGSSGTVTTEFTIEVSDAANTIPVSNSSVRVVTTITDKNVAPHDLTLSSAVIDESATAIVIGDLNATDANGDALSYLLVDQNGNDVTATSPFEIQDATVEGVTTYRLVTKAGIQVSADEIRDVWIKVSDGKGGSVTEKFTVTIRNVNSRPTGLALSNKVVNESSAAIAIGTLTAADQDGDTLGYVLVDSHGTEVTDASPFEIQAVRANGMTTYRLATKAGIQVDRDETRDVWIKVSDGKGGEVVEKFTITINDLNRAPVNLTLSKDTIDESGSPVVVGILNATDPDGDALSYLIVDKDGKEATDTSLFEIRAVRENGTTVYRLATKAGIQVTADETRDVYVKASDSKGGEVIEKFTVTIKNVVPVNYAPTMAVAVGTAITNATDTGPHVSPFTGVSFEDAEDNVLTLTISFNPAAGDLVFPEGTSFQVATQNGIRTYTLTGRKVDLTALIDNVMFNPAPQASSSGTVETVFTLGVADAANPVPVTNGSIKVVTTITDKNRAPDNLKLAGSTSGVTVLEGVAGAEVGDLSGNDQDGDSLQWSFDDLAEAGGNAGGLFVIEGNHIKLAQNRALEYDGSSAVRSYTVFVKARDGHGGETRKAFTINVGNDTADDNRAPDNLRLSNSTIDDVTSGVVVGLLGAEDPDGDALSYVLVNEQGVEVTDAQFEVQAVREEGKTIYRLVTKAVVSEARDLWVKASDGHGGSVVQKFTINVRDVVPINHAPTLHIAEGAAIKNALDTDDPVRPFMGVGFDDAEDDELTVSISFDSAGGDLVLPSGTETLMVEDAGIKTYTFSGKKAELAALMDALAFDPALQPRNFGTVETIFTISVKDALHAPAADRSVAVVTTITNKNHAPERIGLSDSLVFENSGNGTVLGTLSAHDADGDTLVYTLADDLFYIEGNQLRVKDGAKLDFETAQSHQITIQVSDGVTSVGQTYTITIGDKIETLTGTKRKDVLEGGIGSDIIKGGYGNDTMSGGGGQDFFVFDTKLGTSKTDRKVNFDTIRDFKVVDDAIWLDDKIFKNAALKKLGKGASEASPKQLTSKFFKVSDKAKDKDDYIIYNKLTGVLSYDADGSGSKHQAVEFAKIGKNLALTSQDFFII